METIGTKLLDFSQPFDVALLDQVVVTMNDPGNSQRDVANRIMVALQEHQESWNKVCDILEQSNNPATKFFGLQILEDAVKYRWKILPADQREGIKTYIVNKLLKMSSDEATLRQERTFVHKLDLVLVQVLKHEWPQNWPTFISDIVNSSKSGEVLCENNMFILKLLSEEIFDFSRDQMTTIKAKRLKESLNQEFTQVFQLCEFVLENSSRVSLVSMTLQTLLRFLSWIPLGFIFETNLVAALSSKFFQIPAFRNDTLSCLAEISCLADVPTNYQPVLLDLYSAVLSSLDVMMANTTYKQVVESDEIFVQRLSLFFTGFFNNHLAVLESKITSVGDPAHQMITKGFTHLVNISGVEDDGIFKICLEYWHGFTKALYSEETLLQAQPLAQKSRKALYANILTQVRLVMISQMVKPSEVLIVEDENGEIVRETTKDTEALSQYKTMHETLVYLTHLNYEDTENIMLEKLAFQVDGSEWSWNNLNTLCWAIGSISGSMSEEAEKRFLVTVIKDLLGLCEMKRGKDNKAVIASNIMYVVGQYPRFLRAHWKFLKTVVNKLFEFMHELHPGVQDMACDTFLKISQKCRRKFVTIQQSETEPFVCELLTQLPTIVSDLEPHQVHTFYESVGSMLAAETDIHKQQLILARLMDLPNAAWQGIMAMISNNMQQLFDQETMKEMIKILRTNVKVCSSVGSGFMSQMNDLFNDLLNVYQAYSVEINARIQRQGPIATKMSEVRSMRGVKREILKLIRAFIENSKDKEVIVNQFLRAMLQPVLTDYSGSIPEARESEALLLMATCIDTLKDSISEYVPPILEHVFECTLQMITKNFEDFPEHRMNFFKLLKVVNDYCFQSLFSIPPEHQKLVVDSIVWAFKHTERNIADTGLETLFALLLNVQRHPNIAQGFYGSFYLTLLQDILAVLTDRLHKSGFKMHATILKHMFALVEAGHVTIPLYESTGTHVAPGTSNTDFLKLHVAEMIATSFPNLSQVQVADFVTGCFDMSKDLPSFKNHLRDVLVRMKEFAGEDNTDLYREERLEKSQLEERQALAARLAVPGLVNPNEQPDDMADL